MGTRGTSFTVGVVLTIIKDSLAHRHAIPKVSALMVGIGTGTPCADRARVSMFMITLVTIVAPTRTNIRLDTRTMLVAFATSRALALATPMINLTPHRAFFILTQHTRVALRTGTRTTTAIAAMS